MRKHKLTKFLGALAVATAIVGTPVFSIDVSAGSSDIIVDDSSFAESLNSAYWNAPEGDIEAAGGKILFKSENSADSRLIMKSPIAKSAQHEELFQAEYTLNLRKVPDGKRFVLALSLANMESLIGEEDSLALSFENHGGALRSGVYLYDADGKENVLTNAKSVGASFGSSVTIKVSATKDMRLSVIVNGKTLYKGNTSIDLTGRMGFLQNAPCEVAISHVYIVSHKYDTPENPSITEDFEHETINVNAFDSYMKKSCNYFPCGLTIEEYNGENVLMFRNVGIGWFGTTYQYSNFECTFDVPYILFQNALREDGTIIQPVSGGFVFSYGDASDYYDDSGYANSADGIYFENTLVRNLKDSSIKQDLETLGVHDRQNNVGYSVKIRMVDTQFTMYIKALNSDAWQEVFNYKVGNETPTGYIHIWSTGSANFAIDNFKITNLDKDANTIEVDYKTNP